MPHKRLIHLVVFVLTVGCASPSSNFVSSSSSSDSTVIGSKPPAWILNPNKPGYQSVVGAAPKQDWGGRETQYRVALMKARQELAQMVRLRVESTNRSQIKERAGKVSPDSDIETRLQSSVGISLDEARVIEEWVDPQSGELYLWLVTPN